MVDKKDEKVKSTKAKLQEKKTGKLSKTEYLALYLQLLLITLCLAPTYALFETCDETIVLKNFGQYKIYNNDFSNGTSCRYKFIAPVRGILKVQCNINLPEDDTCSTDKFYIDVDGYKPVSELEGTCGKKVLRARTKYRTLVLAYDYTSGEGASFGCTITPIKQKACRCGWSTTTRIVGGVETGVNEYPSMVAIRQIGSFFNSFCAGSLISTREILTAAHCTDFESDPNNLQVIVGDQDLTKTGDSRYEAIYNVSKVVVHPFYNANTNENDIAIIRTVGHVIFSAGVGPICLPFFGLRRLIDKTVTALGWGTTSFAGPPSDTLLEIDLSILSNTECQNQYQNITTIYMNQFCTYDKGQVKDTCQLDSGGPIIVKGKQQFLVGIISAGLGCGNTTGINTRVYNHLNWIQRKTRNQVCQKRYNPPAGSTKNKKNKSKKGAKSKKGKN